MGCNCKNGYKSFEKYSDNGSDGDNGQEKLSFPLKILRIIMQMLFGIFCSAVIIVMVAPMLLYVFYCLITGSQAHFKLKNFSKKKGK